MTGADGGSRRPAPRACSKLDGVTTYYGQMRILDGISLEVGAGELVCLLGGNASGKSTTLKTILGIVRRARPGAARRPGRTGRPVRQRIALGLAIVPENRPLFGQMTVRENLELGAVLRGARPSSTRTSIGCNDLFPRCLSGATSSRAPCLAASSRWSPWAGR